MIFNNYILQTGVFRGYSYLGNLNIKAKELLPRETHFFPVISSMDEIFET